MGNAVGYLTQALTQPPLGARILVRGKRDGIWIQPWWYTRYDNGWGCDNKDCNRCRRIPFRLFLEEDLQVYKVNMDLLWT